ncbi:MAG: BrnT family toxin [Burkholderiales bacterium]
MDERHHIGGNDFVWDEDKAATTWRLRGIRFEDAATVFADPLLVLIDASRNDEGRDAVIGFDRIGRLLFVVHIEFEGDYIRIISARPAEPAEEALYAQ